MAKPSVADVRAVAAEIKASQPQIGTKKLIQAIKDQRKDWRLGNKELRQALAQAQGGKAASPADTGPAAAAGARSAPAAAAPPAKKKRRKGGGEASAGTAQPAASQADEMAGSVPESLPFAVDEADHAETPQRAYEDVAPVLRLLAAALGKEPSELRIWDPFFCTGAPSRRSLSLSISFRWG